MNTCSECALNTVWHNTVLSLVQQYRLSTHYKCQTLSSWTDLQGQRRPAAALPQSSSGMSRWTSTGTHPNLTQTVSKMGKKGKRSLLIPKSTHKAPVLVTARSIFKNIGRCWQCAIVSVIPLSWTDGIRHKERWTDRSGHCNENGRKNELRKKLLLCSAQY